MIARPLWASDFHSLFNRRESAVENHLSNFLKSTHSLLQNFLSNTDKPDFEISQIQQSGIFCAVCNPIEIIKA